MPPQPNLENVAKVVAERIGIEANLKFRACGMLVLLVFLSGPFWYKVIV